jgi:fluoride exporter
VNVVLPRTLLAPSLARMSGPLIYFLIGSGSALGGMLRYALSSWLDAPTPQQFPWGILIVNALGCLAMGLLAAHLDKAEWKAFLLVGVLGGFTTFSAFSMITVELLNRGRYDLAGLYIGLSLIACIGGCWAGFALVHAMRS